MDESKVTLEVTFTATGDTGHVTAEGIRRLVENFLAVELEAPVKVSVVNGFLVSYEAGRTIRAGIK